MASTNPPFPSTGEAPSMRRRPADLLHRGAWVGAVCAFGSLPLSIYLLGPWVALSNVLIGVGLAISAVRARRGDGRGASIWFSASALAGVLLGMLTQGGLSGWWYLFLASLPVLGMIVDESSRLVRRSAFVAAAGLLALVWALPDTWVYEAPEPETVRLMRLIAVALSIGWVGSVATYSVRRLETELARANAIERRARRAADRKAAFLANISHELRTPMNAILGYSELVLEDEALGTAAHEDVGRIRKAGGALLDLINEVLDHARLDAGEPAHRKTCSLTELVERWVAASGGVLVPADPGSSATVQVDPERLDGLVRNLVEGFRRRRVDQVELSLRLDDDLVVVRFRAVDASPSAAISVPLGWLLAERSARSVGVRVHRGDDGQVELLVPVRSESPAVAGHAQLDRWPLGITFPHVPADPMDALRVRLSIRIVWFTLGLVGLAGPATVLLQSHEPSAILAVVAWGVALIGVLVLYRVGRHHAAGIAMTLLEIGGLLVTAGAYGGANEPSLAYLPAIVVLGTLIVGPRGGHWPSVFALAGLTALGIVDQLGLLPFVEPPRVAVAVVTMMATALLTGLVAMWAQPLEALVESANEAATRASEADRATSNFLDVVSIELRTPLNAILGYAEMLQEESTDASVRADLTHILDAGRHLLAVVDDLLDMSAIVADDVELHPELVELRPLMSSVFVVVQPMVERRDNVLVMDLDPELDTVVADPKRFRQILANLISNAAKFTEHGMIEVIAEPRGDDVSIQVRDTGIGIAEADLRQLFEPFRQVHRGSPGQYGGTGLGLAISRRLAQMMGGDISVASTLGEGSTFTVRLPMGATLGHRLAG